MSQFSERFRQGFVLRISLDSAALIFTLYLPIQGASAEKHPHRQDAATITLHAGEKGFRAGVNANTANIRAAYIRADCGGKT